MGLFDWLSKKLNGEPIQISGDGWADDEYLATLREEACYRDMALWNAIDLISRSISKCEIKEYQAGEEVKKEAWYMWNIEPNKNQNSSQFWRKMVASLYLNRECLVVQYNEQLLVADDFSRKPYALYEDVFENVRIGDFTFSKKFVGGEVLYWNLDSLGNSKSIQSVISAVAASYAKLLSYTVKSYQTSRGNKGVLTYDTLPKEAFGQENAWLQKQQDKYSKFLSMDSGVVSVGKGLSFDSYNRQTTYSNENTRDIRAMIDDISDFTAKAFGIPPALLRGDVQGVSDAMEQYLTFCIDPLVDMLREEIVRKFIGRSAFMRGDNFAFDTRQIKHIDVIGAAASIDKLIASGVYSVNDVRSLLGEQPLDDAKWDEHFITKNYVTFDEALKGGESE